MKDPKINKGEGFVPIRASAAAPVPHKSCMSTTCASPSTYSAASMQPCHLRLPLVYGQHQADWRGNRGERRRDKRDKRRQETKHFFSPSPSPADDTHSFPEIYPEAKGVHGVGVVEGERGRGGKGGTEKGRGEGGEGGERVSHAHEHTHALAI